MVCFWVDVWGVEDVVGVVVVVVVLVDYWV